MGVFLISHNQIVQYETPAVKYLGQILHRFTGVSYRLTDGCILLRLIRGVGVDQWL